MCLFLVTGQKRKNKHRRRWNKSASYVNEILKLNGNFPVGIFEIVRKGKETRTRAYDSMLINFVEITVALRPRSVKHSEL